MAVSVISNHCSTEKSISTIPQDEIKFKCVNKQDVDAVKRLYHADNLDVLNYLLKDVRVCGKVELIYIDPPYNTGGAFETKDFKYAYNDKFTTEGYISFMRARLEIMYKLMSPSAPRFCKESMSRSVTPSDLMHTTSYGPNLPLPINSGTLHDCTKTSNR